MLPPSAFPFLLEMQQQGVVRYLGVTGHYRPEALIESIHRHPFDCILMALNAADPHHYSFTEQLLPLAVEKQMGIIGMKVPARGRILSNWTPPPLVQQEHSWEEMVITDKSGTLSMRQAMYYTLSRPVSTILIGCDSIPQLEENVNLAKKFHALQRSADGRADLDGRAGLEAVALLPLLRSSLIWRGACVFCLRLVPGRDSLSFCASSLRKHEACKLVFCRGTLALGRCSAISSCIACCHHRGGGRQS
jgi:Aldo/keto reductase family